MLAAITCCLMMVHAAVGAEAGKGNLVSVGWLEKNLRSDDVLLLDASPAPMFAAGHIPGAVSVDVFSFGAQEMPPVEMERLFHSWGISAGKKIVIYDQGGTFFATRLFFDLYYHGLPATDLFLLDGGMSKWQETGGPTTKDPTPAPLKGSFRIARINNDARVRLPEFLVASGEPINYALVEAMDASYHFGEAKFFDRAGHVPNAIMLPTADLYNPDKTFKSPEEIKRMLSYLGIRPEQSVLTHCGGGVAASVPFFALKFIVNYPRVSLYKESQLEWLRDDRGLPFWTYDAPNLRRDMNWLNAWGNRMMRSFGLAQLNVVDVRPAETFRRDHVPFALNVPADVFRSNLDDPRRLAEVLGAAGVNPADEAVIVSEGGLNERSALAFLLLERLGQKRVSILMDSVDEWGLRGLPLTKEPTIVGAKKSPQDLAVPAVVYRADLRPNVMIRDPGSTKGQYPKVFLATGKQLPGKAQPGKVIHVPYTELLNPDGAPKAAKDLWNILVKAGVSRYAEIICVADEPGEAAIGYFILKLMGYADVKVLVT
jgi:3-mercaptopyruvate sulfurtransferase SseA